MKKKKNFDNSNKGQRIRLLNRLRKSPVTTVEARHELDVLSAPPRIYELRWNFGYNIKLFWTKGENPGGGSHRIGKYVLLPGKWRGGAK